MNTFYRDVNSDDAFNVNRFGGFAKLQKGDIKNAIFSAGFDLHNFGRWIRDDQIYHLAEVRMFSCVLADTDAKGVFVNSGIRSKTPSTSPTQTTKRRSARLHLTSPSPKPTWPLWDCGSSRRRARGSGSW